MTGVQAGASTLRGGGGRGHGLELAAVLMLTAGSAVVVVGWLVGVVLLWSSPRWSRAEKWLGTLVVPLGAGGIVTFGGVLTARTCASADFATGAGVVSTARTCAGPPAWIAPGLLLPAGLAGVVVAVVLYRRVLRR
ncbi:MAG TPA: hypothetical protein VFS29_13905 [Motilibacteraceae bacterium]|nr:hypothetical protein [Motilibacteraceae bacterium]